MTTPDESVPVQPPVVPEEAAAQDAAADAEAAAAAQLDAIRELATQIAKQAVLDFDPATIRKGTVTAIATASAPPTLSVQISGDTTTTIDGVRYIDSYAPVAGDTVLIIKQGTDLVALGEIAAAFSESGWTTAALGVGFTHNANSGGNVMYRKIWDHGSPKMQWKGVAGRSSGTLVATVPAGYRPVALRPLIAARTAVGGANDVKVDMAVDGSVNLVGGTTSPASVNSSTVADHGHTINTSNHSHGGLTQSTLLRASTHSHGSHSHPVATSLSAPYNHAHGGNTGSREPSDSVHTHASHTHDIDNNDHSHGGATNADGSHQHTVDVTVTDPVWISFNGIEYFLD